MDTALRKLPPPVVDSLKLTWAVGTVATRIASNTFSRWAPRAAATLARLGRTTGRGSDREGAEGAKYFRAVADDYEVMAVETGAVARRDDLFRGRHVLEVGPGNTKSVGLLARLRGAASYAGVDGYDIQARTEGYLRGLYEPLLLQEGQAGGYERARELLRDCPVYVGNEALRSSGRKFDLVISRAVLEHVQDLDALYATLREVTTDDALLIHKVDLRCHGVRFDSELDFLLFPENLYGFMSSHNGGMPNRVRVPGYLDLGQRHGFALVHAGSTHLLSHDDVQRMRDTLPPPYGTMSEETLRVLGVWLVQVGPAHPLASKALTTLGVDSLPRAPLDKLSTY